MASEILMQLGDYQFSAAAAAYDRLTRAAEYRWAAQDRIGAAPALQWVGEGPQTVDLGGAVYPFDLGDRGQVQALRDAAAQGDPLQLVAGTGDVLGFWVILSVREVETRHAAAGVPRRQEFELRLQYYGDSAE